MDICRRTFGACMLGALAARSRPLPPRPKLLVLVILEQFRNDYVHLLSSQLSGGGLRKLFDKGAYFPDCRHLASTFPHSSIATLATGAWPAQHGIIADSWYDRASKKRVQASDEMLTASTLTAQVGAMPGARVSIVSLSAVHAGLFAGTPDARVYWMDDGGQFTTRGDAPDWLAEYNSQRSPDALHGAKWVAAGAKSDALPLRILNYDQNHPGAFFALYKSSPFAQDAQFDLVGQLVTRERLGQTAGFDFVCVMAGSGALLGYETGSHSPLMDQMILRADLRIEALIEQLNRAVGENGFNLVVTGAHGAPPEPTSAARARVTVNGESVAQHVDHSLTPHGMGRVQMYLYPFLYLDADGFRDPEPIRLAAGAAALEHPAVANYYTAGGACSTHDDWERRFRNSFHPKRSGDVMLSYRPEYIEQFDQSRGVSYGSLYNYDAQVPLCFYGPQFRAGVYESPVESVDIAPTLARAIGVAAPSSATGRVLGEALSE